jgi:hypothetical protein
MLNFGQCLSVAMLNFVSAYRSFGNMLSIRTEEGEVRYNSRRGWNAYHVLARETDGGASLVQAKDGSRKRDLGVQLGLLSCSRFFPLDGWLRCRDAGIRIEVNPYQKIDAGPVGTFEIRGVPVPVLDKVKVSEADSSQTYEIIFRPHEENFAADETRKADDHMWNITGLDGELKLTIHLPTDPTRLNIFTWASNGAYEAVPAELVLSESTEHLHILAKKTHSRFETQSRFFETEEEEEAGMFKRQIKRPYDRSGDFTSVMLNEEKSWNTG